MKFLTKLLALLFVLGLVLSVIAFFGGLDIAGLKDFFNDDESYGVELVYTDDTVITKLVLDVETRNISVIPTDSDVITIKYHEHEKDTWSFVEGTGVLTVTQHKELEVFNWFNWKYVSPEIITVYVEIPEVWLLELIVSSNVGNITIDYENIPITNLAAVTNTGRILLSNLSLSELTIDVDTGNVNLNHSDVANDILITSNTGNVFVDTVNAQDINISSDTGDITLKDVEGEDLFVDNDTGFISLTRTNMINEIELSTSTGNLVLSDSTASGYELSASTGDVIVTLVDLSNLRYDLQTSTGNIKIDGAAQGNRHTTTTGSILLKVRVSTGNIRINGTVTK